MIAGTLLTAGASLSLMTEAIKSIYGIANDINDHLNKHIEEMKGSENPTISRTGRVLEMAKFGFGIGYITPVVVIAVGQLLLGNSLTAAASTVATAATLTNPIAMTCAAVGAIYYGWGALTDNERNEILDKISKGLEIGFEFIKSVIRFITEKTRELLDSKNLEEIKKFISSTASVFGRSLGAITHKLADRASDTYNTAKYKSHVILSKTGDVATEAIDKTVSTSSKTYNTAKDKTGKIVTTTLDIIGKMKQGRSPEKPTSNTQEDKQNTNHNISH